MVVDDRRTVVFVAASTARPTTITRRRSVVWHGNSVYIIAHVCICLVLLVVTVLILEGICCLRHLDVHIALVPDWGRAVSMDAVPFWRLILTVEVHLRLELVHKSDHLPKTLGIDLK